MPFSGLKLSLRDRPSWQVAGIIVIFGAIYSLISLVNHYCFRTYAFDLGIFNNAIYDYAHLKWNDNPVKRYENILSDHFTLLHLPFSLFSWLFGSYTLLIIQIATILFGGYGAYKYHLLRTKSNSISILLLFQFFTIWGVFSALAYDYHDNVIAAMLVPWLFYFFHQKRWRYVLLFYGLILFSKENMALWAIFLNLGLAVIYFKDKAQLRAALLMSLLALVYFVVVVKFIIPSLATGERAYTYIQNYGALGGNFSEILTTLLTKPLTVFGLLFQNHLPGSEGNWIKTELHIFVLLSGGFALFYRPAYLIMLLPIYGQKLFISNYMIWGLNYQYSIEFVPILNIALMETIVRQPFQKKLILTWVACLLTLAITVRGFDYRFSKWYDKAALQFYKQQHYRRHFNVAEAYQALKLIPEHAPVSALSPLVPHLAFRDFIYEFPYIENAQYIALIRNDNPYPLTEQDFKQKIDSLQSSPNWKSIYDKNHILILRNTNSSTEKQTEIIFN